MVIERERERERERKRERQREREREREREKERERELWHGKRRYAGKKVLRWSSVSDRESSHNISKLRRERKHEYWRSMEDRRTF